MNAMFSEALAHQMAGRLDQAAAGYRKVLQGDPQHVPARLGLALLLLDQDRPEDAADVVRGGAAPPDLAAQTGIYARLGLAFQQRRRFAEAADWFRCAVDVQPGFAAGFYNLGLACQNQGQLEAAIAAYRQALDVQPDLSEPRRNLAYLLQVLGRHGEAVEVYRAGLRARPQDADLPRYLVGALFYDPAANNTLRFEEARRFGARLRHPVDRAFTPHANSPEPGRRLRIGYVTSDFADHPVGRNMEMLLAARDTAGFEVIVYADVLHPDAMTERLRGLVDAWHDISALDDRAAADRIRGDGIDMLVILAGHFDRNRPGIAAFRPAPVQISFHDITTSGADGTFDYLIADRTVAPAGTGEGFTERVLHLPSIYAHRPLQAPDPGPPPCRQNGYVTFGSFNNPAKINGAVLAVWAQVLAAVPGARFAFKFRNWFHAAEVKARIISAFAVFNIAPERLVFLGGEDTLDGHLGRYREVDIVLDPFPFTGSTATFEALWMGVPVVTLAGPTMMARWSTSILNALHLGSLVTSDVNGYVATARDLAGNAERLAALRAGLRQHVSRSPLCDARLRARQVERLYRAVWRRWCREGGARADVPALMKAAQQHHEAGRPAGAAALYRRILAADPLHAPAFHFLGALDLHAGRHEEAADRIAHALKINPQDAAALTSHGHALQHLGRLLEAEAAYRGALALDPFRASALAGLSEALSAQGRVEEAVTAARKAAAIQPDFESCRALGAALQATGRTAEAIDWLRKASALRPQDAGGHYNLGAALQQAGQTDEAMGAYRRALELDPDLGEAHNNLGLVLIDAGEVESALTHLSRAASLQPSRAAIHNNLGMALQHLGRLDEALGSFEQAIALDPDFAEAHANAGGARRAMMRLGAAADALQRAIELKPGLVEARVNLGLTLRDLGRLDEARATLEGAVSATPEAAELHMALGIVLNDLGLHVEGRAACRRAVDLKPQSAAVQRSLLAVLLYGTGVSAAERFAEHRRFGRLAAAPAIVGAPRRDADPERRLRIGYVSSDLCRHPVGRNLTPILVNHDRERFAVFAYATMSHADDMTEAFRRHCDGWRSVAGAGDRELARDVAEDGIDVLVHLAGRFDRNRPTVAAYRAAPVQVSFHDPATSGVPGMDYLIADRVLVPRDASERFSERLVRLPSFYVHDPLAGAPEAAPLPAASSGAITFGIFNNPAKLSDDSLALWAEVLRRVPRSRLLFRFQNRYGSATLRRRIAGSLAERGIAGERIEIVEAGTPGEPPLAIYNRVDLALDPHPFTGSTTTFESLWMGVPVLTLAGDTMVGRWSASMLRALRLDEFVTTGPEAYVERAVALCADLGRLSRLRQGLRAQVAASPLCDGQRRARQVERLYRALWRRWCRAAPSGVS